MQVHGGVYADMDFECVNGLSTAMGGINSMCGAYSAQSSTPHVDGYLQNSLLASKPAHPFWARVLERAHLLYSPTFLQSWLGNQDVISSTGPKLLSDTWEDYDSLYKGDVTDAG
jgi:mannosyltransferase OCH1-like enzyme